MKGALARSHAHWGKASEVLGMRRAVTAVVTEAKEKAQERPVGQSPRPCCPNRTQRTSDGEHGGKRGVYDLGAYVGWFGDCCTTRRAHNNPKDWNEAVDARSGKTYYWHKKTKETRWTKPEAAKPKQHTRR